MVGCMFLVGACLTSITMTIRQHVDCNDVARQVVTTNCQDPFDKCLSKHVALRYETRFHAPSC